MAVHNEPTIIIKLQPLHVTELLQNGRILPQLVWRTPDEGYRSFPRSFQSHPMLDDDVALDYPSDPIDHISSGIGCLLKHYRGIPRHCKAILYISYNFITILTACRFFIIKLA